MGTVKWKCVSPSGMRMGEVPKRSRMAGSRSAVQRRVTIHGGLAAAAQLISGIPQHHQLKEMCIRDSLDDVLSIEYVPRTGKNRGCIYEQFYKGDKCRLFVWLRDTAEVIDGKIYKKDLQGTYWDMKDVYKRQAHPRRQKRRPHCRAG